MTPSKKEISLTEGDLASVVALLSEVALLNGSIEQKKLSLMQQVAKLIDADCWVWTLLAPTEIGEKPVAINFLHGGFTHDRLATYAEAIEHPDMASLNAPFLNALADNKSHTTRTSTQLDPKGRFQSLPVYRLWQRADIEHLILSSHPFSDGSMSFVALYRSAQKEAFSQKQCRITHIILSEIKWLHSQAWPERKEEYCYDYLSLSPRQRTILNLLLEGQGRKQIASQLNLSENTVAGYAKEIYRFYKVQSHAELVSRFRFGDGGDAPPIVG